MNTIVVSATKARNNFFSLLDEVAAGKEVIIEIDKKEVAVISQKKKKGNWEGLLKASQAAHGILKDAPYDELENNPVRRRSSWKRLGTWDKGLKTKET